MNRDQSAEISRLFAAALELDPAVRPEFLERECSDGLLRAEVLDLLERNERADRVGFLEGLTRPDGVDPIPDESTGVPDRFIDLRDPKPGGMGVVYRARDVELGRDVAYKVMKAIPGEAGRTRAEEFRRRFAREARITADLQYPGIVPVFGMVTDGCGCPAYAMQYVEGTTFRNLIRMPRRVGDGPPRTWLKAFSAACRIIQFAHDRGYIHGDISPRNLMFARTRNGDGPSAEDYGVDEGAVFVVDWGLARHVDPAKADEGAIGPQLRSHEPATPFYSAPGVIQGGSRSIATDVYSLGAVLAALVLGVTPEGRPDLARLERVEIPRPLRNIIKAAMVDRDEGGSYKDAAALADEVGRYLDGERVLADREPLHEKAWRVARHHPVAVTLAVASALIAMVVATATFRLSEAREHAARIEEKARRLDAEARRSRELVLESKVSEALIQDAWVGDEFSVDSVVGIGDDVLETILDLIAYQANDQEIRATAKAVKLTNQATSKEHRRVKQKRDTERRDRVRRQLQDLSKSLEALAREFPKNPNYQIFLVRRSLALGKQQLYQQNSLQLTMSLVKFLAGKPVSLPKIEEALGHFNRALATIDSIQPGTIQPETLRSIRNFAWFCRAATLMTLFRFTEALISFDKSLELAGSDEVEVHEGLRLVSRLAAEIEQSHMPWSPPNRVEHERAIQMADYLVGQPNVSSAAVFNAACAFSLASLDERASEAERERRASRAVALLARIEGVKYFLGSRQARDLCEDKALDPLRQRTDFRILVEQVANGK